LRSSRGAPARRRLARRPVSSRVAGQLADLTLTVEEMGRRLETFRLQDELSKSALRQERCGSPI
jgi:hypothetical protein